MQTDSCIHDLGSVGITGNVFQRVIERIVVVLCRDILFYHVLIPKQIENCM